MIIIKLKGGLGNQLFQVYGGVSYALNESKEYRFDDSLFKETTNRKTYWDNIFSVFKSRILNDVHFTIVRESGFEFCKINDNMDNIILDGFYQSYKYFSENFQRISNIIQINNLKNEYKGSYDSNLCSIHFRYGDYKNVPNYHTNLGTDYYKMAIQKINELANINNFLVFFEEEDRQQVENILSQIPDQKYTFINNNFKDYEQLFIMSNCSHNIIANSTFSWWAAFFNENPNKIVIRPINWFGSAANLNISDLCPDNWIAI